MYIERFDRIHNLLENKNLVGDHSANSLPNIYNFSFPTINNCSSFSNRNFINRFYHRIITFFNNFEWLNDEKISLHLIYEYIWIKSSLITSLCQENYSKKNNLLAQINLLDQIFEEIILKSTEIDDTCTNVSPFKSIPQINFAKFFLFTYFLII